MYQFLQQDCYRTAVLYDLGLLDGVAWIPGHAMRTDPGQLLLMEYRRDYAVYIGRQLRALLGYRHGCQRMYGYLLSNTDYANLFCKPDQSGCDSYTVVDDKHASANGDYPNDFREDLRRQYLWIKCHRLAFRP